MPGGCRVWTEGMSEREWEKGRERRDAEHSTLRIQS